LHQRFLLGIFLVTVQTSSTVKSVKK
jgi:hypothetical protein